MDNNNLSANGPVIDPSQLAPQGVAPTTLNHLIDITPGTNSSETENNTATSFQPVNSIEPAVIDITPNSTTPIIATPTSTPTPTPTTPILTTPTPTTPILTTPTPAPESISGNVNQSLDLQPVNPAVNSNTNSDINTQAPLSSPVANTNSSLQENPDLVKTIG